MRRFFALFFLPVIALPAFLFQQGIPVVAPENLEITGVNAAGAPDVTLAVNVTDAVGRTVKGLGLDDFQLGGALSQVAEIVQVESIADDNLALAVVLVIDTSSSMAGAPLERTQAAAKAFVSSLAAEDTVALVSFNNDSYVVREFTTDKQDILNAIDNLRYGGQTALYDGAVTGIELAASAPHSRRAVILLSDGAEYGGASMATRAQAAELSPVRGVPVYTIGLGFGRDRSFLEELSNAGSARFYESPTPDELAGIYTELAELFRSQYVLTLDFKGPLDGRVYPLTLRAANSAGQSNIDAATLRAPIPVPLIRVSPEPTAPLASPVTFTANVRGDQDITQVEFTLNGETVVDTEAPYTFALDPFTREPADYVLSVRATDADGDIGELDVPFSVAAIPSRLNLSVDLAALGEIREPVNVTLGADSQTPVQLVDFRIDGISIATADALPAEFTLDPAVLAPGPHTVEFVVTDAAGAEAAITQTAQIAALPPRITFDASALEGELAEDVTLTVEAAGQTPVETITFSLNDESEANTGASASYTIRPQFTAPGAQTLIITAVDQSGTPSVVEADFNVALLPPLVTIDGLSSDDVLDAPREFTVTVDGQTDEATVRLIADTNEIDVRTEAPYTFALNPATLFATPGTHLLTVEVQNRFGATETTDLRVTVPETLFPTATPNAEETAAALRLLEQATLNAQSTADTASTQVAQATAAVQSTLDAQFTAVAQATQDVFSTLAAEATATARAQAANQRLATTEARATQQVQGTIDAQLTEIAQQTQAAVTTRDAQATLDTTLAVATQAAATEAVETAEALRAEQTSAARSTAEAQLTSDAESRATMQAEVTVRFEATLNAASTRDAAATEAVVTQQSVAEQTIVAQIELTNAAPLEQPTDEPSPTAEPTAEPSATATEIVPTPEPFDPTSTPGAPVDVVAPGGDAPETPVALLAIVCGIGLLALIVVLLLFARRNRK